MSAGFWCSGCSFSARFLISTALTSRLLADPSPRPIISAMYNWARCSAPCWSGTHFSRPLGKGWPIASDRAVCWPRASWWGIFTALTAMVPANIAAALLIFVAVRFLLGAGEAVIYPSANQFVARWVRLRNAVLPMAGSSPAWARSRRYAFDRDLHYGSLRLEIVVLGLLHHRIRGWCGVVFYRTRHAR